MTRFSISLNDGVNLVLFGLQDMRGGETYIPKMPSMKIFDLVKIFKPKKGYKITGIRPGEKLHEELISKSDSSKKIEFDKYFVVLPSTIEKINISKFMKNFKSQKGKILKDFFCYDSLNCGNFLTTQELKKIIFDLN
jgi:FlaA1/EpsC-like NDP-sugar epimerase